MKSFRIASCVAIATIAVLFSQAACSSTSLAQETGNRLRFKKPSQVTHGSRVNQANLKFRSPTEQRSTVKQQTGNRLRAADRVSYEQPAAQAKPRKRPTSVKRRPKVVTEQARGQKRVARKQKVVRRDRQVVAVLDDEVADQSAEQLPQPEIFAEMPRTFEGSQGYESYEDPQGYESIESCGAGCTNEAGCGLADPGLGFIEPGCGLNEPSCGLGGTSCGSCVGRPGSDYWCFPVCLPRFKDLSVWGGVQGFRGPRDFSSGRSDSNFGFHEGINISGRAPLVGLLFPQLSYQLGYQAVQSRLSGTTTSTNDRSQNFVTAGLFRRVKAGLQFGVVWDMLQDDLDETVNYYQIRSEISLKSPRGREIGFWSTASTNSNTILGVTYETVDMYALFYRWNFGKNYEGRLWGGATGNSEGIFGGEFQAPLSDRWSLVTGFNYLIPDTGRGPQGVQQEAWNIGINLVWHMGRTARRGSRSPFRPLFAVADNGWMVIGKK